MMSSTVNIMDAFDNLIETLEESAIDPEIIGAIESAKEMFEEEIRELSDFDDDV